MRESLYDAPEFEQRVRQEVERVLADLLATAAKHFRFPALEDERLKDMDFGTLLRWFRLRRGLSAAKFAADLRVHASEISRYEKGTRYPSPRRFQTMVIKLGLSEVERGLMETELMKRLLTREHVLRPKDPGERMLAQKAVNLNMKKMLAYVLGLPVDAALSDRNRYPKHTVPMADLGEPGDQPPVVPETPAADHPNLSNLMSDPNILEMLWAAAGRAGESACGSGTGGLGDP